MKQTLLNYRVIVKPDTQTGTGKPGYTALCPTLGVADDGDTIDQALHNLQAAMQTYIDSLVEDNLPVPKDNPETETITTATINVLKPFKLAY